MSGVYKGLLFTMVGPAGAGKNTVMREAIRRLPELRQLPTATTRAMRATEAEGREHYFITVPEFMALRDAGKLLEQQVVHGNWYGIARDPLEEALSGGELMIADIDMYGAQAARANFPRNTVLVFVAPPSIPLLAARMTERGEKPAEIARRMLRVGSEMSFAPECDYVIVNDSLEQAAQGLLEIIEWERRQHQSWVRAVSMPSLRYLVRALVVAGDRVLVSDGGLLPQARLEPEQVPHRAALDLALSLGVSADPSLLTTFKEEDSFLAPAHIEVLEGEAEDECVYTYVLRVEAADAPAAGWHWQHMDDAALPPAVRPLAVAKVIA